MFYNLSIFSFHLFWFCINILALPKSLRLVYLVNSNKRNEIYHRLFSCGRLDTLPVQTAHCVLVTTSIVVADIKVTKPQSKRTTAAFFVP